MVKLSIIIPAFNEAERIEPTLRSFYTYLSQAEFSYEIIVVDDGSSDSTIELVETMQHEIPEIILIPSEKNMGKGHAVRAGMLKAKGSIRLFSDADGSTPISELDKLLPPMLKKEADICIGSRYLADSKIIKAQPWYRVIWSRMANFVVQKSLLPGIVDPYCGFKIFSAEAANKIFSKCEINEWTFDLEVLAMARKLGLNIQEVPVEWINDEDSKARKSDVFKEIYNLFVIKRQVQLR